MLQKFINQHTYIRYVAYVDIFIIFRVNIVNYLVLISSILLKTIRVY